jgi:hypothetical protein
MNGGDMLKRVIVASALVVAACAPAPDGSAGASGGVMPVALVDPYVKIHDSLATDTTDGVTGNAGAMVEAAQAIGAPAADVRTAAAALADSTDISDARSKFAVLSDAVVAYQREHELALPEGVRVAVCPMILKPWMQRGDSITNPYYGSSMLTCGDFK